MTAWTAILIIRALNSFDGRTRLGRRVRLSQPPEPNETGLIPGLCYPGLLATHRGERLYDQLLLYPSTFHPHLFFSSIFSEPFLVSTETLSDMVHFWGGSLPPYLYYIYIYLALSSPFRCNPSHFSYLESFFLYVVDIHNTDRIAACVLLCFTSFFFFLLW